MSCQGMSCDVISCDVIHVTLISRPTDLRRKEKSVEQKRKAVQTKDSSLSLCCTPSSLRFCHRLYITVQHTAYYNTVRNGTVVSCAWPLLNLKSLRTLHFSLQSTVDPILLLTTNCPYRTCHRLLRIRFIVQSRGVECFRLFISSILCMWWRVMSHTSQSLQHYFILVSFAFLITLSLSLS